MERKLFTEIHWNKNKHFIQNFSADKVANWFLQKGFYPEYYVLPPCFNSEKFKLKNGMTGENDWQDVQSISFPKGKWTDRIFGVIKPNIYHDIVFLLKGNWSFLLDHFFSKRRIFSYSFPVPVDSSNEGEIASKKSGRMIYEYIEMAEKDLVADSAGFPWVVHADIKNCYPSIYSHSIPWALHSKEMRTCIKKCKKKECKTTEFGMKLDKLVQNANNGCTNGVPIGPATSDLMCEIVLSAIDRELSKKLESMSEIVDFVGVRFKDDYRVLCKSKKNGKAIIKELQGLLSKYNLHLNDDKTKIEETPIGLYRPWVLEPVAFMLEKNKEITMKDFERAYFAAVDIFKKHPGRGLERFLSQLVDSKNNFDVKIVFSDNDSDNNSRNIMRFTNLLWSLVHLHSKILPQVLGIIESLFEKGLIKKENLYDMLSDQVNSQNESEDEYFLSWVSYFLISNGMNDLLIKLEIQSIPKFKFLSSILQDKNCLFEAKSGQPPLFEKINKNKFGRISTFIFPFHQNSDEVT